MTQRARSDCGSHQLLRRLLVYTVDASNHLPPLSFWHPIPELIILVCERRVRAGEKLAGKYERMPKNKAAAETANKVARESFHF